jgi:hypothetical protein
MHGVHVYVIVGFKNYYYYFIYDLCVNCSKNEICMALPVHFVIQSL